MSLNLDYPKFNESDYIESDSGDPTEGNSSEGSELKEKVEKDSFGGKIVQVAAIEPIKTKEGIDTVNNDVT